ncbi:hypothetical protein Tco_1204672 [Tanacetum coccineum]
MTANTPSQLEREDTERSNWCLAWLDSWIAIWSLCDHDELQLLLSLLILRIDFYYLTSDNFICRSVENIFPEYCYFTIIMLRIFYEGYESSDGTNLRRNPLWCYRWLLEERVTGKVHHHHLRFPFAPVMPPPEIHRWATTFLCRPGEAITFLVRPLTATLLMGRVKLLIARKRVDLYKHASSFSGIYRTSDVSTQIGFPRGEEHHDVRFHIRMRLDTRKIPEIDPIEDLRFIGVGVFDTNAQETIVEEGDCRARLVRSFGLSLALGDWQMIVGIENAQRTVGGLISDS